MKPLAFKAQRLLIAFLALIVFCGTTSSAQAALSFGSLAQDTTGAIAAAEVSCHLNVISAGIKNIFGTSDATSKINGAANVNAVPVTVAASGPAETATKQNTAASLDKQTCSAAVTAAAKQVILKDITIATVNWINHGFNNGGAAFAKNEGDILKSIGDSETRLFMNSLGFDGTNFPFGRAATQYLLMEISRPFEMNAAYSLDKVISQQHPGMTTKDFVQAFENGGWVAFENQFNTENHPLAFQMYAANELARRTAYTRFSEAQSIQAQMARAGGFLDSQKCVSPANYDPNAQTLNSNIANSADAAAANQVAIDQQAADQADLAAAVDPGDPGPAAAASQAHARLDADLQKLKDADQASADANKTITNSTCLKWETQTPGSVIASTLNKALGTSFDQLTNGDKDLSADLTAIFDALTNQLMKKGLSQLSTDKKGQQLTNPFGKYGGPISNVSFDDSLSQGTWASTTSGFNLFTGIPSLISFECNDPFDPYPDQSRIDPNYPGAVPCQHNDKTLPKGYQQVLMEESAAASQIINAVYELDYCVPGPHPGWESDSTTALQTELQSWPASADQAGAAGGLGTASKIGKFFDFGGSIYGGILNASEDQRNEKLYTGLVSDALSYHGADGELGLPTQGVGVTENEKTNGFSHSQNILTTIFQRYQSAVNAVFSSSNLNFILALATEQSQDRKEFRNIPTYEQAIVDNGALHDNSVSIVAQLEGLQKRIDALPTFAGYPGIPTGGLPQPASAGVTIGLDDTTAIINGSVGASTTTKVSLLYGLDANLGQFTQGDVTGGKFSIPLANLVPTRLYYFAIIDSSGNSLIQLQQFTTTQSQNTVVTPPPPNPNVRDYQTDLAEAMKLNGVSDLTPYQFELEKINSVFGLIAPSIHSRDDVSTEEAAFSAEMALLNQYRGNGGFIQQCLKDVSDPKYKNGPDAGPDQRLHFPDTVVSSIPAVVPIPFDKLNPVIDFIDFELINGDINSRGASDLPLSKSFLPDYYYGEGTNNFALAALAKQVAIDQLASTQAHKALDASPTDPAGIKNQSLVDAVTRADKKLADDQNKLNQAKALAGYWENQYGFVQDPNKTIQNDDVVTINTQPIPNALAGFEQLIDIY